MWKAKFAYLLDLNELGADIHVAPRAPAGGWREKQSLMVEVKDALWISENEKGESWFYEQ